MENQQEIKRLLEAHLERKLSSEETQELFDRLRFIQNSKELDVYFRNHWNLLDGNKVITDLSWNQIQEENTRRIVFKRKRIHQLRIRRIWQWGVAASVLLLISLFFLNWDKEPVYITYKTNFGETKNIVLDDGSSVILNANSELIWKEDWKVDKMRYVRLKGEAYFKVSHIDLESGDMTQSADLGQRMPFQVKTSDVVIDVLGTTFNVWDRRGETQVYLEEGSVQLGLLKTEISQKDTKNLTIQNKEKGIPVKSVLMKPGETIGYSAETKQLLVTTSEQSKALTEWKDGSLVYNNVLFGDMLDHMEDIYGKKFVVHDSSLLSRNVSFGVPYENWEIVKNLMERALDVDIVPGAGDETIIIKRKE